MPQAGAPVRRGEQLGERLAGALHAGRHDAGGDDGGLEQAEVVAGEVEDLGDGGDVGGGLEVDADQAEDRLVDDAEVGLDGRRGAAGVAARGRRGRSRR